MSDHGNATGRCLCGAVRIRLTRQHIDVGICHCGMCRRWGSGPNMAIDVGRDIEVEGREKVTVYRSSPWAERAFCATCGSNLYYRIVEADDYVVCAGLLDAHDNLVLTSQIFIDEKPRFYDFSNDTETLTGAEVFAKYVPPSESG